MKFSLMQPVALLASMAAFMAPAVSGERMFISTSLSSCQSKSSLSASLFNVVFTPSNNSIAVNVVAKSTISGKVKFKVTASVYGYPIINNQVFDPCEIQGGGGLCPMHVGDIGSAFNLNLPAGVLNKIPAIGYEIPDLDATVHVEIFQPDTAANVACLEASISNGKTVDLLGVKWATAVVAGLALISSALVSGLGHSNTASHVASNALSLFGYFQAQAIIGLTAVRLPPIVVSWTQDFQWSMGIIRVGFMQDIFTWYQRATGGEPARLLDSLTNVSVHVQKKRSLGAVAAVGVDLFKRGVAMAPRALHTMAKRASIMSDDGSYVVYGIQRVAFRAKIESTNLFMTGLTFFCLFVILTMLCVALLKGLCELFAKQKWMAADKFLEFRNGWLTVTKGIMFRMTLIGFPQLAILCLWEFTQVDSPAEVVLAVFFFLGMTITLAWGASKVIRIARRSVAMHRNPAYILFSDPQALNKWGFLYVQFRASAYYFIVPVLVYTLVKAMLVAFAQHTPVAQAVGFVILEIAALIGASVMRPWMDKSTNSFNIAICVVNFLNSICLLLFSNVFGLPLIVTGVAGVVLFILNAVFALVLLIMIIVSTIIVFFRKNPDARYQVMADDRASFMKSQTQLNTTTELDALAATARGDKNGFKSHLDLDDDGASMSSENLQKQRAEMSQSQSSFYQGHNPPRSPVNPSMPLFPANERRPESPFRNASPSPYARSATSLHQQQQQQRVQNNSSPAGFHSQNNAGPWQRGAGYDN